MSNSDTLSLEDFDKGYKTILEEIGIKEDGTIASHSLKPSITIEVDDPNDDLDYEIVGLEPEMLMGCNCWSGVIIKIRKAEE